MKKIFTTCFLVIFFCLCMMITLSLVHAQEPNEPRQIVMPKNTKLSVQYLCPIHGLVDKSILTIDIDGKSHIYCKTCVLRFMVDVFDLNLSKLEVVK